MRGGGGFRADHFGPDHRGWREPYRHWGLGFPYYDYAYPYDYGVGYVAPTYSTYSTSIDSTAATVQQALADAGYYHGAIDGVVGPATISAITAYQRDNGLPVTGAIDDPLLQSLGVS
jgi:hypothetical protein